MVSEEVLLESLLAHERRCESARLADEGRPRRQIDNRLNLRFPEKLRLKVEDAAQLSGETLNKEIINRLEQSFAQQDTAAIIQDTVTRTIAAMPSLSRRFRNG